MTNRQTAATSPRARQQRPLAARLSVLSLALGVGLVLLVAVPAEGRWVVPDTLEPVTETVVPKETVAENGPLAPDASPVALPDQAQVPILMYHYVSELPPDADRYRVDLTVAPQDFRAQLDYLAGAGYHPITLTDLYLNLTQGYPLPDKPIVLTFDDGYRDAYEVVFPLLLEHGFTATFFVLATPAHYEWEQYLTWTQISEMAAAGMDIQGHGRDHVDLRGRSYDYLVYQILGVREAVEYHTGQPVRFFCYPAGQYDAGVIAVLQSAGYWGAVTTQWGHTETLGSIWEMPRLRVRGTDTLESFIAHLGG